MIGLVFVAVVAAILGGLALLGVPALWGLVPAIGIPDIAGGVLGISEVVVSFLGILAGSVYSFRLVSPLIRALTMSRQEAVVSEKEETQGDNLSRECNERLQRGISYRAGLSGLLIPEPYPVKCPEHVER